LARSLSENLDFRERIARRFSVGMKIALLTDAI